MRHRVQLSIAAVAAAALLTAACGDSGSPTEPSVSIDGAWTGGVLHGCQAAASFIQHGIYVSGTLQLANPCQTTLDFQGRLEGNALDGTLTDYDTFQVKARGTVSVSTLDITLTDSVGAEYARLHLHR